MLNFKENPNFQNDLLIEYMDILKTKDQKEEFDRIFKKFENQYDNIKTRITKIEQLKKLQGIIEYKKSMIKGQTI